MHLTVDIYYSDAGKWQENKHPRGQPENAGEFVEKGIKKGKPFSRFPQLEKKEALEQLNHHLTWMGDKPPEYEYVEEAQQILEQYPTPQVKALVERIHNLYDIKITRNKQLAAWKGDRVEIVGGGFDKTELSAIKSYVGNESFRINRGLREGINLPEKRQKIVDRLDSALAKSRTKAPLTVYRGLAFTKPDRPLYNQLMSLKVGGTVGFGPTYLSTSGLPAAAAVFAYRLGGGISPGFKVGEEVRGVILQIDLPKGAKALDVQQASKQAGLTYGPLAEYAEREKEFLLPRGVTFRVTGRSGNDGHVIHLEPVKGPET